MMYMTNEEERTSEFTRKVGSGDTAGDHVQNTIRHKGDLTYEICASRNGRWSRDSSLDDAAALFYKNLEKKERSQDVRYEKFREVSPDCVGKW